MYVTNMVACIGKTMRNLERNRSQHNKQRKERRVIDLMIVPGRAHVIANNEFWSMKAIIISQLLHVFIRFLTLQKNV